MATINMLVGQSITLNVVPFLGDVKGTLSGTPIWSTANSALVGLTPSDDGRSCKVTAKAAGSTTVTCNAVGSAPLSANHTVTIAAASTGLADSIELSVVGPPS